MLRLKILPEGYIYPKEERMARDLLRKRLQLVRQNTLNILSIHGLYARHLNCKLSSNKLKQLTPEQIAMDFIDPNVCLADNGNLAVMQ